MYNQDYNPFEKHKEQRIIFSKAEDDKLRRLVEKSGKRPNWKSISAAMKTRSPRQCRERYRNYLNPNIEHSEWTKEEDQIILSQFDLLGHQWKKISGFLPGRTGNSIRNRYHSLERQRQRMAQMKAQVKKVEQPAILSDSSENSDFNFSVLVDSLFIPIDSMFFEETTQ